MSQDPTESSPSSSPASATGVGRWTLAARLALGVTLVAEAVVLRAAVTSQPRHIFWLYCWSLPLFALALLLFARSGLADRRAVHVLLGVATVLQILAVASPPRTSDDDFRYVWDATVQLAGIDPYRYVPQAPELERLRDPFLFPPYPCPHPISAGCTRINRPFVPTIYPPVAEGAFTAMRLASFGGHGGHLPIQVAAALGCLAIALLLIRRARARGTPLWHAAAWAWCPMVVLEYGNNGHIDWLAVLFAVLALNRAAAGKMWSAGLLVGAAIGVKLYPAVLLPSLLRRRPFAVLVGAFGLVAASYLPHVLAVGTKVIGYLPGYLREEQYASGKRLALLGWVVPHSLDTLVGAALLAVLAAVVLWRADPDAPERSAVVLTGVAFLVATPKYGWYSGFLVALVALSGSIEWLAVALVPTAGYLLSTDYGYGKHQLALRMLYVSAALVVAIGAALRLYVPRRRVFLSRTA